MTTSPAAMSGTPSHSGHALSLVWRDGAIAGVVAAAATTAVAVLAKAAGVPMEAAPQTAAAAEPLPMAGFAITTIGCTLVGLLIATAISRWAPRPATTWVVVTVVLTVVSFAGPITTGYATTATRLVLALTHVLAAAIIIPAVARRLA